MRCHSLTGSPVKDQASYSQKASRGRKPTISKHPLSRPPNDSPGSGLTLRKTPKDYAGERHVFLPGA